MDAKEREEFQNLVDAESRRFKQMDACGISPTLQRATQDTWRFTVGLKNGCLITFSTADWNEKAPEFIKLREPVLMGPDLRQLASFTCKGGHRDENDSPIACPEERGIEVRISEIVWVIDDHS